MSQKCHFSVFLFVAWALLARPLLADGFFVSDNYDADVYAPDQKVVISWDGKTETMILATKVRSSELANFGWIIPIRATAKPRVELGNIQVFFDLSDYFRPPEPRRWKGAFINSIDALDSVEVLETKELGLYDITVLRATDSDQLYSWLRANDFRIEPESTEILGHYTNKEHFFVTAKIDLMNEYEDDVEFIRQQDFLGPGDVLARVEKATDMVIVRKEQGMVTLSTEVTSSILLKEPYEQSVLSRNKLNLQCELLSKSEYDELMGKYGLGDHLVRIFPVDILHQQTSIKKRFLSSWYRTSPAVIAFATADRSVVLYGDGSSDIHGIHNDGGTLSHDEIEEVRKYVRYSIELETQLSEKFDENENMQHFWRIWRLGLDLSSGIHRPLKIAFRTRQPFFPLRISSANKGRVGVTAYILSSKPMLDASSVLTASAWKKLSLGIRTRMSKHIPVRRCRAVTKLTFAGDSSQFSSDAHFRAMTRAERRPFFQPHAGIWKEYLVVGVAIATFTVLLTLLVTVNVCFFRGLRGRHDSGSSAPGLS